MNDPYMAVEAEWQARAFVPAHVENVLRVMPDETHPMTLFSQGILALQTDSQFVKRYTVDQQAYSEYLRGRYLWNRRYEGLPKALECFNRAIERDPSYALAHAGIADCYSQFAHSAFMRPLDAPAARKAAATRALQLDPDKLGKPVSSIISVKIGGEMGPVAASGLVDIDGITDIYTVTGDYDLVCKVACGSIQDLEQVVERIRALEFTKEKHLSRMGDCKVPLPALVVLTSQA
jgi:tetratricopeptide (TPR) repeat protein